MTKKLAYSALIVLLTTQVIGQCGKSAEELPLYFRGYEGLRMPKGGAAIEDGTLVATGATVTHQNKP